MAKEPKTTLPEPEDVYVLELDKHALNEARWAACNTRFTDSKTPPSMKNVTEAADNAIRAYLENTMKLRKL